MSIRNSMARVLCDAIERYIALSDAAEERRLSRRERKDMMVCHRYIHNALDGAVKLGGAL